MQPPPAAIQKCQVAPSCQQDYLAEILKWSNSKWKSSALSKQNCLKHLIRFQSKIDIFLFKLTDCKISHFCPSLSGWSCAPCDGFVVFLHTTFSQAWALLWKLVGYIVNENYILVISVSRNFILIKTLVSHNTHLPAASCQLVSHLQQQELLGEKNPNPGC